MSQKPLGRRAPQDMVHVERYPFRAASPTTSVERTLPLPWWHWSHDQVAQGSCVGHGAAMERAITNTLQARAAGDSRPVRRYDPIDLWDQAKLRDGFPETNPGDDEGTTVEAGYDVLRDRGPRRVRSMRIEGDRPVPVGEQDPDPQDGVSVNRWATTVDEMRAAFSRGVPVVIGVNWYENFDDPEQVGSEWWIGRGGLGGIRGGHCVCLYGVSDRREAFKMKNSWGRAYPLVWLPYATMQRLLDEWGEAVLTTDR